MEIKSNIDVVDAKIKEYYEAMKPIKQIEIDVFNFIAQMESLFKFDNLDEFIPIETNDDEFDKISVEPIDDFSVRFNYKDIEYLAIAIDFK